jgi:hypothetical protein
LTNCINYGQADFIQKNHLSLTGTGELMSGYFISGGWGFPTPGPEENTHSEYPLPWKKRNLLVAVHITYFDVENRRQYLDKQLAALNNLSSAKVDIFVHTNVNKLPVNQKVNVVTHDLTGIDPHLLTWKHRNMMREQLPYYDVFMYMEDDILFEEKNWQYWLKYHELVRKHDTYAGFIRTEQDISGKWWCTDIVPTFGECHPMPEEITLENVTFTRNGNNFYNGFWILDNTQFLRYTRHTFWDLHRNPYFNNYWREKVAIGIIPWFKNVIVKLDDEGAYVHHMPNNYIGHYVFGQGQKDLLQKR